MNKQDYEQKKRECWKEFCKAHPLDATANGGVAFRYAFDRAYALGRQECKEEVGEGIYNLFREKVQNNEFLAIPDNPSVLDRYLEWSKVFKWTVSALGKKFGNLELSDTQETVISGWVARDSDGTLTLFEVKPERVCYIRSNEGLWMAKTMTDLVSELFPDLTWDSDPIEVELRIKRKNE